MTSPDPELLFGDIAEYIAQAEGHLAAQDVAALAELNSMVDTLATRFAALPSDITAEYAPEVEYLIEKLTALQHSMLSARETLSQALDVSEKRLKAVRAYHGSPSDDE